MHRLVVTLAIYSRTLSKVSGFRKGICHPGSKFFKFPGSVKKGEARKQWIKNVNRVNPDGTPWHPKKLDVVCYKHFVDGRPTLKYPVTMGHQYVSRVTGRSRPTVQEKNCKRKTAPSKRKQTSSQNKTMW